RARARRTAASRPRSARRRRARRHVCDVGHAMTAVSEQIGMRLGEAIRTQRHGLGLTLVEVAARTGLSHPFLSQLERGLARPSMRSLTVIASALETSAQALLAVAESPAADSVCFVSQQDAPHAVESPG